MNVFITGATGFIGTKLIAELLATGHQVCGLARSDAAAEQLQKVGAKVQRGNLKDLESLRAGASGMDAVVNLAFNHEDMSKFAESAADEMVAIEALTSALTPGKLFLVTSGVAAVAAKPHQLIQETDRAVESTQIPRKPERAAAIAAAQGLHVGVLRMPQVHDRYKQGLVTYLIQIAAAKGVSAYVGEGANRWAAGAVGDVAHLYRLALEKTGQGLTTYHAVGEEGVSLKAIAEAIGKGLKLPTASIDPGQAENHFGMFAHFAAMDMPASSTWTQRTLGWKPIGPGMIDDLENMKHAR